MTSTWKYPFPLNFQGKGVKRSNQKVSTYCASGTQRCLIFITFNPTSEVGITLTPYLCRRKLMTPGRLTKETVRQAGILLHRGRLEIAACIEVQCRPLGHHLHWYGTGLAWALLDSILQRWTALEVETRALSQLFPITLEPTISSHLCSGAPSRSPSWVYPVLT